MSSLLDAAASLIGGGSAPASVRVPAAEVSFGSASADDWAKALVSVSVTTGAAPAVDAAEVVLAAGAKLDVSLGDAGSVSLGYGDGGTEQVFAGEVSAVHRSISGSTRVTATNGGSKLAALRLNRGYEQRTAGDVVRDLAQEAGVDTGSVDDGTSFAYYVVDDGRSAWVHAASLAARSGFLARFAPDGKLAFGAPPSGGAVQSFSYAQDVLALDGAEAAPATAVTVVGEGAAGSKGSDAWSWLAKDASGVTADAGGDGPKRLVRDRSLRSAAAVKAAASALADAGTARAGSARLLVPGAPKAAVGTLVSVAGAPDAPLDGTYVVRGVRHRHAKRGGLTTLLLLDRSGGGAGGLL